MKYFIMDNGCEYADYEVFYISTDLEIDQFLSLSRGRYSNILAMFDKPPVYGADLFVPFHKYVSTANVVSMAYLLPIEFIVQALEHAQPSTHRKTLRRIVEARL